MTTLNVEVNGERGILHVAPEPEQVQLIQVEATEMLRTIRAVNEELAEALTERRALSERITGLRQRLLELTGTSIDNYLDREAYAPTLDLGPELVKVDPDEEDDDDDHLDDEDAAVIARGEGLVAVPTLAANETPEQWLSSWAGRMEKLYGPFVDDSEEGQRAQPWLVILARYLVGPSVYSRSQIEPDFTKKLRRAETRVIAAQWERASDEWPSWIVQP